MRFAAENGNIIISADANRQIFNAEDKLLHSAVSGWPISGSLSIGTVSTDSRIDNITSANLGAVPTGHTQLIGACKFDLNNSGAGLAFDRWHTVMGGSIVWIMDGEPGFTAAIGDNGSLAQFVYYWFDIAGGQARLNRKILIDMGGSGGPVFSIISHTITYKLRSGNWT